jgi:hypothetical protein
MCTDTFEAGGMSRKMFYVFHLNPSEKRDPPVVSQLVAEVEPMIIYWHQ